MQKYIYGCPHCGVIFLEKQHEINVDEYTSCINCENLARLAKIDGTGNVYIEDNFNV